MRYNILFGGPAGTGPNVLTHVLAEALVEHGNHVYYSRDYQSLIRGGHNFNVLTFADEPVWSNDSKYDIIVALDENTEKLHGKNLKKGGIILKGKHPNMYFAGRLFKMFCLDFKLLEEQFKKLGNRFEENMKEAKLGYDEEKTIMCKVQEMKEDHYFENGNQGISNGAVKAGLEIYYAYPMTPATPVLSELAERAEKDNLVVLELENEIAVVNAGVGSSITGKKTMVGTSGGGFDLMTEGLSLCGIAGAPLVFYLSQRPGPGTGVATYTGQGDLHIARNGGHGEFNRIVLAPGDPKEAEELTSECFYFSHKYGVPSIIVGDKHLAESFYTLHEKPSIKNEKSKIKFGRYNSYEIDSEGSATEDPEIIEKNVIERMKVGWNIEKEAENFSGYESYGNKNSKNVIVSWGSTKGAIIDAIEDLDVKFVQIKYIEPFPKKVMKELKGNLILVENNCSGSLGKVLTEKLGIFIEDKNKILKFDGRPFFADELREEINKRVRGK